MISHPSLSFFSSRLATISNMREQLFILNVPDQTWVCELLYISKSLFRCPPGALTGSHDCNL